MAKKNSNDRRVTTQGTLLLAQIEVAKTVVELRAVLAELVKRLGVR